jgi:hypothetical protein
MNTLATNRMVDNYFRFMKYWDTETKKRLIIKLNDSIRVKSKDKFDFSSCYGAWNDSRPAEDVAKSLKADRIFQREIEEF